MREKAKQIAYLLDRLVPIGGRCGYQEFFEFRLSRAQRFLVGFDLRSQTPKVSGLLGCHATMSIEIGGLAGHGLFLRVYCLHIPGRVDHL